jgi:hypothetical protein
VTGDPFGAAERAAPAAPIRPGVPGESPCWNRCAARFILAPAFDFAPVPGPLRYRFEVTGQADSRVRPPGPDHLVTVEARVPGAEWGGP